ncbi:MAG: 50S ribosomal protein L11 methyltransferase [Spirochaetes bacterium]|nr:50S ribosomal protein L11 methyltransferase [Spirochaetota bacterium]
MITPRSVDWIFSFPPEREEEIEGALLGRGFGSYFIEFAPGLSPTLHLVFHEGDGAPTEAELAAFLAEYGCRPVDRIEKDAIDWIKTWIDSLEPFELAGGLWVNPYPDRDLDPGLPSIRVVPGFAFGTGHHATTRLAARLVARQVKPGGRVLDVGCGTAILALLAVRLGAGETLACDNDPMAVSRARETVAENRETGIQLFQSDLLDSVPLGKAFDLIIANIVSEILLRLLEDDRLAGMLAPGGTLILSGIHPEGKAGVTEKLGRRGWRVGEWVEEGGWWGLSCGRP